MTNTDPRKVSFLDNTCDNCGKTSRSCKLRALDQTDGIADVGWVICNEPTCQGQCDRWVDSRTTSLDALQRRFGHDLVVQRSSGELEHGWTFWGNAFQESSDDTFWVRVTNGKGISKYVSIEMIENWQVLKDTIVKR